MNEIRIPIKLDVLQSSVGELQKILNNLQPNTSGYKALQKIINSMTTESQKLGAQLSKPFNSEGQFKTTSKTIDKIEESAARMQIIMDGLKFSDLKLTPQQQSSFDELNSQIEAVRANYKKLTEETKTKVMSNASNSSLIAGLPKVDAVKASFGEIKDAVDQHVKDLQDAANKQQAAFENLKSNIDIGKRAEKLTSKDGGLTREALGDNLYDKFFSDKGGKSRLAVWKDGVSKQGLLDAISQEFKLDPDSLKDLASKTMDEINKAFQSMGEKKDNPFANLIRRGNAASGKRGESFTELADIKSQLEEYKRLQLELNQLQNSTVGPADKETETRIGSLNTQIETLQQQILKTIGVGGQFKGAFGSINTELDNLKTQLDNAKNGFLDIQRATQTFNQMKMAVTNFMGFNQVLNITKRAVKEAANHIKELDTVMNKISIVTDMSTGDLWKQIGSYSDMAQNYGVSIKGAYEVSQIYYQQGLQTNDVMTLTNETLKLAKISGLDYAATTDYMTTALRGFKMEMSEASTVVDVYSNLASHTAVTQEELAVAMSKTASSMESVGSSFEESSAMIATMVAVTRESATNIGSALKSIAARYGEMKKNPSALVDSEGEVMAFNKVDAALQSVGISMKTTDGQFRDFTDVIIELSEKWNTLESTQQRYIATQFAGNRQQSRFLALVSNADLLKQNLQYAENSEGTGEMQALKALDSVESKLEQVRVAYQQFYTSVGAEAGWKTALDGIKNYINYLNGLHKAFGKFPIGAIAMIGNIINIIKTAAKSAIQDIAGIWKNVLDGKDATEATQSYLSRIRKWHNDKKNKSKKENKEEVKEQAKADQANITAAVGKTKAEQDGREKTQTADYAAQAKNTAAPGTPQISPTMLQNTGLGDQLAAQLKGGIDPSQIDSIATDMVAKIQAAGQKTSQAWEQAGTDSIQKYLASLSAGGKTAEETIAQLAQAIATKMASFKETINTIDPTFVSGLGESLKTLSFTDGQVDTSSIDSFKEQVAAKFSSLGPDIQEKLRTAFKDGGDMAIAGLVNGLLNDGQAIDASSNVGQAVIAALKAAMGVASPSVDAQEAAGFVVQGIVVGLNSDIGQAIDAANTAGTSVISAIKDKLENTQIDVGKLIQFISPNLDLSTMTSTDLEKLRSNVQYKATQLQSRAEGDVDAYNAAINSEKNLQKNKVEDQFKRESRQIISDYQDTEAHQNFISMQRELKSKGYKSKKDLQKEVKAKKAELKQLEESNTEASQQAELDKIMKGLEEDAKAATGIEDARNNVQKIREAMDRGKELTDLTDEEKERYTTWKAAEKDYEEIRKGIRTNAEGILQQRVAERKRKISKVRSELGEAEYYAVDPTLQYTEEERNAYKAAEAAEKQVKAQKDAKLKTLTANKDAALKAIDARFAPVTTDQLQETINTNATGALARIDAALVKSKEREEALKKEESKKETKPKPTESPKETKPTETPQKEVPVEKEEEKKEEPPISEKKSTETVQSPVKAPEPVVQSQTPTVQPQAQELPQKTSVGMPDRSRLQNQINQADLDAYNAEMNAIREERRNNMVNIDDLKTRHAGQLAAWDNIEADTKGLFKGVQKTLKRKKYGIDVGSREELEQRQQQEVQDATIANIAAQGKYNKQEAAINAKYNMGITPTEGQSSEQTPTEIKTTVDTSEAEQKLNELRETEEEEPIELEIPDESDEDDSASEPLSVGVEADIGQSQEEGAKAKEDGFNQGVKNAPEAQAEIKGNTAQAAAAGQESGEAYGQEETKAAQNAFQPPELTNSKYNVYSTGEGGAFSPETKESIEELLSKLQEVGTISEEQKAKLLELYNTKPPADFVEEYNKITGMGQVQRRDTSSTLGSNDPILASVQNNPMIPMGTPPASKPDASDQTQALQNQATATQNAKEKVDELERSQQSAGRTGVDSAHRVGAATEEMAAKTSLAARAWDKLKTKFKNGSAQWGSALGSAFSTVAGLINRSTAAGEAFAGSIMAIGGAVTAALSSGPMALVTGITTAVTGIVQIFKSDSLEKRIERAQKKAEEMKKKSTEAKAEFKSLDEGKKKVEELEKKRYDSAEAAEEYQEAVNDLTSKFPELILGFDEAGDAIINTARMEDELTNARKAAAEAAKNAARAELERLKEESKKKIKTAADKSGTLLSATYTEIDKAKQTRNDQLRAIAGDLVSSLPETIADTNNPWGLKSTLSGSVTNPELFMEQFGGGLRDFKATDNDEESKKLENVLVDLLGTEGEIDYNAALEKINSEGYLESFGLSDESIEKLRNMFDFAVQLSEGTYTYGIKDSVDQKKITNQRLKNRLASGGNIDDVSLITEAVTEYDDLLDKKKKGKLDDDTKLNDAYQYMMAVFDAVKLSDESAYLIPGIDGLTKQIGDVGDSLSEFNAILNEIESTELGAISEQFDTKYNNKNFIKDNSGLKAIITNHTKKAYTRSGSTENFVDWLGGSEGTKVMYDQVEDAEKFWTETLSSDTDKENFSRMLRDTKHYDFKDLVERFKIEPGSPLYDSLSDYYQEVEGPVEKQMRKKYQSDDSPIAQTLNKNSKMRYAFATASNRVKTASEQQYVNNVFARYDDLTEHGYNNLAENYAKSTLDLYKNVIDKLPSENRNKVLDLVEQYGITTKEGLSNIIKEIESDETLDDSYKQALIDGFQNTKNYILSNINLELQSATENYLSQWEEGSKTLSKLDSGIDLSDVNSIMNSDAAKVLKQQGKGLSITDFISDGNKMILASEKADDYIEAYFEAEQKKLDEYRTELENINGQWGKLDDNNKLQLTASRFNESDRQEIEQLIGEGELEKYATKIEKDGTIYWELKNDETLLAELQKKVETSYDNAVENLGIYGQSIKLSQESLKNTRQWNKGNYESIVKETNKDFLDLMKMSDRNLGQYKNMPNVKNAVTKARSATSNLLKDLVSKPLREIDFSSYEGLPKEIQAKLQNLTNDGIVEFVSKYADAIGGSISDANDLVLSAYEKQHGIDKYSRDALKDLTFINQSQFTATSSELKAFANRFDLKLADLFKRIVQYDAALGEYVVNYTDIKGLDLSQVEGFQATVQDSLNSFWKQLADLVKKGLSGSLSYTEADELRGLAKRFNYNPDQLNFEQTVDGLRLSDQSAISLYAHVKDINTLQSQLVFKELNDSLKESNGHYQSISANIAHIADLQEKADATTSEARKQQYQEELEVAKEILAVRSTTEDSSFDFMSNKIPGPLNNPLKYAESWGKAWKALRDSFKGSGKNKGLMDYQDFYNIITEMGNLAEKTGQIRLSGETVLHNSEEAAKLIEQGSKALKVSTDGSVKVDLSAIGIDFATGAENLETDVNKGIKEVAHAQIEMLDAAIQLLEVVVAMEQLKDVDVNTDNVIDLREIFKVEKDPETGEIIKIIDEFTKEYGEARDKLIKFGNSKDGADFRKAAEGMKVKIGDNMESMWDILNKSADELKGYEQEYAALMNSLYQMAISGNYSTENIIATIKETLAASGFDGDIILNDVTYTVHQGTVLRKDADGNYKVGDQKFSDVNKAANAMKASEVEALSGAMKKTVNEDSSVTYTFENDLKVNMRCNAATGEYTAVITTASGDTTTIKANSEEEIGVGVATVAKLKNQSIKATNKATFTIMEDAHTETKITVDMTDVDNPKVYDGNDLLDPNSDMAQAAIASFQEQVDGAGKSASGQSVPMTISGLKLDANAEGGVNINLDGQTIGTTGTPEKITINNVNLTYEGTAAIPLDLSGKQVLATNAKVTIPDNVPVKDSVKLGEFDATGKAKTITVITSDDTQKKVDNTNVLLNDSVTAEANASALTVLIGKDGISKTPKFTEDLGEDGLVLDPIDQVTAGTYGLKITTDANTNIALENSDSVTISEANRIGKVHAQAAALFVDAQNSGIKTLTNSTEIDFGANAIDTAKGSAQKLDVSFDIDKKAELENSSVELQDIPYAYGAATDLKVIADRTKGSYIHLEGADSGNDQPVDLGNLPRGKANVTELTIDSATNIVMPGDLDGEATILATIDDQTFIPYITIKGRTADLDTTEVSATAKLDDQITEKIKTIQDTLLALCSISPTLTITSTADVGQAFKNVDTLKNAINEIQKSIQIKLSTDSKKDNTGATPQDKLQKLIELGNYLTNLDPVVTIYAEDQASSVIAKIREAIENFCGTKWVVPIVLDASHGRGSFGMDKKGDDLLDATGNVGLAKAQGTLMGELGPELVVSKGRYFVVGQAGPEMVKLADDAIVFNHLQTRSLLEKGMSTERGRAVTNERNAVSFAKGNINGGPAKASASEALSTLKKLRAQWEAIAGMSAKDLAGKGGGGGGGGNSKDFIKDLEKWYNWLQKIARLEKEITYQESLRSRIASDFNADGYKYFNSQVKSLRDLTDEIKTQKDLLESQQKYFNKRRDELNSDANPFQSLYWFDDYGQLKYKDGKLEELSKLFGTDKYDKANMSPKAQYEYIVNTLGIDERYLKYDTSGNEIKHEGNDWYTTALQTFWDKIDADKEEMQSLYDSLEDLKNNVESNLQKQNELLKEIEDNQISVENRVLDAIVSARERQIEEMRKERDAIEKSNTALIKGLTDALSKEKQLYENSQNEEELTSLQRQLMILQRSGGSASEINGLQQEIASKQQDIYFNMYQQQIDALQEASDKQLERLDKQISLEEETLEYEKAHGMLWEQVYQVMSQSPEDIATFIKNNDAQYWGESPTKLQQESRQIKFEAEQWKAYSDSSLTMEELLQRIADEVAPINDVVVTNDEPSDNSGNNENNGGNNNNDKGKGPGPKTTTTKNNEWWDKTVTNIKKAALDTQVTKSITTQVAPSIWNFIKNIPHNASGGLVKKPTVSTLAEEGEEAVFNAEQTRILRENILSNNPNSLISLLKTYNESYDGLGSAASSVSNSSNNSTVIEHAEVHMHVDKLANSYDSARAADDVMKEMINIARKTNGQNRIGR